MHFHFFVCLTMEISDRSRQVVSPLKKHESGIRKIRFFSCYEVSRMIVGFRRSESERRTSDLRSDSNRNPMELSGRYELVLNINSPWKLTKN